MKSSRIKLAIIATSLCLGATAGLQAADRDVRDEARERDIKRERADRGGNAGLVYASNVIGQPVRNNVGQEIGRVNELIMDTDGQVQYGVIQVGKGFLGIGDKKVAVPWQDLQLSATQGGYRLDVTKEALMTAPAYSSETYSSTTRPAGEYRRVSREAKTYDGKVVAINREAHTITVRKGLISHDFTLADGVQTANINVGDEVTVTYSDDSGKNIAQSVLPMSAAKPQSTDPDLNR